MAPQIDPLIPPLVSVRGAARVLGCSRTWAAHLVREGYLHGVRVGRLTVVAEAQVAALVAQRDRGVPGWRPSQPGPAIPPLSSTADAATLLGYAQDNWPRELFERGELPGLQVGADVVFRRQLLTERALLAAVTSPAPTARP